MDTKLATFEAVLSKTLEAVGRGRQKLLGRAPVDDLGAHMAAQDAAGHQQGRSSSDADFLAGLAEPTAPVIPAQVQAPAPQEPVYDGYSYQQPAAHQQDAYAAYQDPYGYQQQPDPYAGSYQQQPDPYGAYQQQVPQHQDQQHQQHQGGHHHEQQVPPQPALDETSFFDTSMIDLNQLRQYEQGRQ